MRELPGGEELCGHGGSVDRVLAAEIARERGVLRADFGDLLRSSGVGDATGGLCLELDFLFATVVVIVEKF